MASAQAPSVRYSADSFPLREIAMSLLAGRPGERWQVREDEQWCYLGPRDYPSRLQGWKLHVSATWLSAPMVLHQAGRVLVEHGCAFKFAGTISRVMKLTSKDTDRAQAGKFITAYPRDDAHLRTLADLLDRATAGLPGPAILSDRPVRVGSLVHYRYGAFAGVPVLTNDGAFEARLEAPDGSLVPDQRQPWFTPPAWAEPLFTDPAGQSAGAGRPGPAAPPKAVLLDNRFRVAKAIRHAARGGVYRAIDQQTGDPVVIKQARAHISGLAQSGDARDGLRYEAAMLDALGELAPRVVRMFEQGPHLFLAVEQLAGEPLSKWVARQWQEPADPDSPAGPPVAPAVELAAKLADLVDGVHERGLVYRDLSPNNVMVLDDGSVRLIDAELAARPGDWVAPAHTPGFAAPETLAAAAVGPAVGPAPGQAADHYALGAMLCHLSAGWAPVLPPDYPAGTAGRAAARTANERIALGLDYATAGNPAARRLAPAVLGLTADDPAERWDTGRLRKFLAASEPAGTASEDAVGDGRLEPERLARLAEDGLRYLADRLADRPPDRPVRSSQDGNRSDPCNVQHGAGGVLAVLVRGAQQLGEDWAGAEQLRAAVTRLARWIDRRRLAVTPLLPGLYFGRSGTAWALYEAARYLEDSGLAERALELAVALPARWPNLDITHGAAGAGMASLYLWHETKQPVFRQRVETVADQVLEQTLHTEDGRLHWQADPTFDSALAGATHYGFAHGVAGIGAFLLAAAQATGRADCLAVAKEAGETLARAAVQSSGGTYWPNDISGPSEADLRYHWCSGASGVGTFLVRLWQATGENQYRELAHAAAATVRRIRWLAGFAACHGLAGDGEFLLDMADAAGGPYRDWAREVAATLYARHALIDGRVVVVDPQDPALDFNTGTAGVVGYALRLVYGGPRWWMVDAPDPALPE